MKKDGLSRRNFLKMAGCGSTALWAGFGPLSKAAKTHGSRKINRSASRKPNILILMTDQQRCDSLGCYGGTVIQTPNIDRLAKEGALFENCYSPCPVCTPSRASMLTGKSVPGHGVYKLHDILPDNEILISRRLQRLGYETSLVGKLHVSGLWQEARQRHPNDGFEHYHWCIDPGLNFDSPYNSFARWVEKKDPTFYERLKREGKDLHHFPAELHFSRWAAETTVGLITNRDKNRPFFILMSLFDPHDPYFDHPVEAARMVNVNNIPQPQPVDKNANVPDGVRREMDKARRIKTHSKTFKDSIHNLRKGYYASVAFLDQQIGAVLDCLDAEGLADDTLVIFVSDHGDMLWDRGLFTKGAFFYDASVRVPLLMRFPGDIQPGTRLGAPVQQLDLAATIMALAGFAGRELKRIMPESMDLLSFIRHGKSCENYRDYAVCLYRNTGYGPGHKYFDPPVHATMFRDERFKLNVYHGGPNDRSSTGELYDMVNDPAEKNNLWNDPACSEVKDRLFRRLLDWMVTNDVRNFGSRGGEKFRTLKKNYYGDDRG